MLQLNMGFFNYFSKVNRLKRKEAKLQKKQSKLLPKPKAGKALKVGLALGGGGMLGFGHVGAIMAFRDSGIEFDYVAGTSVGAVIGALYCNDVSNEIMEQAAESFKIKDILTTKIPLMPSKTEKLEALITKYAGDINIEQLKKPLTIVAVDIISGQEVRLTQGSLAKAVAGSCAFPGLFNPVEFNGMHLMDGSLQNTIPSDAARRMGADIVIAVDLNSNRGYGTTSTKYIEVIKVSLRILMKASALKGYVESDLCITPDLTGFKHTKLKGSKDMIEIGYKAAIAAVPEICKLLRRVAPDPDALLISRKIKQFDEAGKEAIENINTEEDY